MATVTTALDTRPVWASYVQRRSLGGRNDALLTWPSAEVSGLVEHVVTWCVPINSRTTSAPLSSWPMRYVLRLIHKRRYGDGGGHSPEAVWHGPPCGNRIRPAA